MRELPTPTLPFADLLPPRGSLHRRSEAPADGRGPLLVSWARHQDEVREAQQLRYQVFAVGMGARLPQPVPGHDIDVFDDYCEHLLVRDRETLEVVGTYRLLTHAQSLRVGSFYTDTEFDLTRLRTLRPRMFELGRCCVHADRRGGTALMAMWSALAAFMAANRAGIMIGCASIPMLRNGMVDGNGAASIWERLRRSHLAPIEHHVLPRVPLPVERLDGSGNGEPPALIRGYLRLGAKLLGPPAWDPDFNTADLPLMLRVSDLSPRYARHFAP